VIRSSDQIATPNPDWNSDKPDPATSSAPFRVFNIGYGKAVPLLDYIGALEKAIGKKAILEWAPKQPGDVSDTLADVATLRDTLGFKPTIPVAEGVARFVSWYRDYYRV
jgi:UDP-glucuronate 4-epimerase